MIKPMFKKKSKIEVVTLSGFKTSCKVILTKTMWLWNKYRYSWKGIEMIEINSTYI